MGRGRGKSEGGREHNGVAMAAAATSVYLETSLANQNSRHTFTHTLAHLASICLCARAALLLTDLMGSNTPTANTLICKYIKCLKTKAEHE